MYLKDNRRDFQMKTLVLVFHPDITTSRANRRLAEEIKQQAAIVEKMGG